MRQRIFRGFLMSKTFSKLENIQQQRKDRSYPLFEEKQISPESSPEKQTDRMVKMGTLAWLAVSITATVFSYTLGVRQGMQQAQADSPKQWLYYYTDSQNAPEVRKAMTLTKAEPVSLESPQIQKNSGSNNSQSASDSPAPAAAEAPRKGFTIQVITYTGAQKAQQEVQKLIQKGHSAFVIPSGKYFQVCIESFGDKKAAMQKLTKLRTDGYHKTYPGAFVRPVRH
jgi:hypothetical protein